MLTALTYVARPGEPDAIDRLADTLSALVAGVAAGLVGDAVIVADSGSTTIATVAEATGAALVAPACGESPWIAGARAARRDWVLCLDAGDVPAEGWIRTLDRFIGTARPEVMLGRLSRPQAPLAVRLAMRAERILGAGRPRPGDVVRRERLAACPSFAPRLAVRSLIGRIDRA